MNRLTGLLRGLLCAALLLPHAAWAGAAELMVEMLDVGQGDGILITTPAGKRVLIDAGTRGSDVVGQLRRRGVEQLDLVVATHPHADHIGGMADVLLGLPVRFYTDNGLPHTTRIYQAVMDAVEAKGITYRPAEIGQSFSLDDDIRLEVLFPPATPVRGTRSDLNSNSVVVRLDHGELCFLFTGDAEEPTEYALLRGGLQACDVLKVAHHGSGHSTTAAWLRTVQPSIALISAGVDNRYGHPDPDTLGRLTSAQVEVYRTDLDGAIRVHSDGHQLRVEVEGKDGSEAGAFAGVRRFSATPGLAPTGSERPGAAAPVAAAPVATAPVAAEPAPAGSSGADASLAGSQAATGSDQNPKTGKLLPGAAARAAQAAPRFTRPGTAPLSADCRYVASRSSKVFHPADCHVVARIWEGNRVCYDSAQAAEASGKTRSQACPDTSAAGE